MANYLVTGAAGFIGARTSEFLIRDGHTVAGVDNLNETYDPRVVLDLDYWTVMAKKS